VSNSSFVNITCLDSESLNMPCKHVKHVRNVMAHEQKPDLVFQRNGQVHLNWRGCQFGRLMAVEECGLADSDCIDCVPTYRARLLATHSIRIFPLHFPSRVSPCAVRFRTRYTTDKQCVHTPLRVLQYTRSTLCANADPHRIGRVIVTSWSHKCHAI